MMSGRHSISDISSSELKQTESDPIAILETARRKGGGLVRVPSERRANLYIVTTPDGVTDVLGSVGAYKKQEVTDPVARRLFGDGALTSSGETWVRQRRVTSLAFTRERMAIHKEIFAREAEDTVSALSSSVTIEDALSTFRSLTLRNVSRALFGIEYPGEPLEFARATDVVNYRGRQEDYALVSGDTSLVDPHLDVDDAMAVIDDLSSRFRRDSSNQADTLLSWIIESSDSEQEIRDQIVTILISGHETTALAITWALFLLAGDPRTQSRLREELSSPTSTIEAAEEDVLKIVISETLRLVPPVYAIGRSVTAETELLGHRLSPDSDVIVSQWLLQRHPECFRRAESFQPSRWFDQESYSPRRGCFFPFGFGPRGCIGERFARTEIAIVLASILRRFTVHRSLETPLEVRAALTTRPAFAVRLQLESQER